MRTALLLGLGGLATLKPFLPLSQFPPSLLEAYSYPLYTVSIFSSWWYIETADGARGLEKNDSQFRGPRPQCQMWRKGLGSLVIRGGFPRSSPCGDLCLRLSMRRGTQGAWLPQAHLVPESSLQSVVRHIPHSLCPSRAWFQSAFS